MDKIYNATSFGVGLLITGAFAKKTIDLLSKTPKKKYKKKSRK